MKSFDIDLATEIAKETAATFCLLEFQFAATYRYTDRDISLYHGGHKYSSINFRLGNFVSAANMSIDRMTIDIDNAGLIFSAILLGEDVRNKTVIQSFGCLNADNKIIAVAEFFRGVLSDWDIAEDKARVTIVNEFILWKKKTLRICSSTCPWGFKETECGYAGAETWCDQSYEHCLSLGNENNFGGHRFLPSIMEKEIWWGRTRK